ncbi:hypothetical protein [Roseobacter sp.]|uniref:hypothetical protein n=1 Tax=Roseobacter sp. TaxID=1907202 RepID=UPI0032976D0F
MKITHGIAVLATAVILGFAGAGAQAQSGPTPQEQPPASFTGLQFVDSRGCAFIRAGQDGAVRWVPRVTRDRRQVCNLQPTVTAGVAAPRAPAATVAAPQVLVLTPTSSSPAAPAVIRPSVPNRAPGAALPAAPGLVGTVVTPQTAAAQGVSPTTRVLPRHLYEVQSKTQSVKVPDGYRSVWQDDRLNPRRGEQTLQGHGQMQQIWTKTAPRELAD